MSNRREVLAAALAAGLVADAPVALNNGQARFPH